MKDPQISSIKGVGICLMVLGHALYLGAMRDIIYLFHMPLFFITTGYLFKDKYLSSPRLYFLNQIKKQYWVYVKWCAVFLLLHNMFMRVGIMNAEYGYHASGYEYYTTMQIIKKMLRIMIFMTDNEPLLAGFWFIRTLFIASVVTCLLRYFIAGVFGICGLRNIVVTVSILFAALCVFYGFGISTIFIETKEILAMIFIAIGAMLKKIGVPAKPYLLLGIVCLLAIYLFFGSVNMFAQTLSKSVEILFTGLIGWLVIFQLTHPHNMLMKFFEYCGNNSLEILIWHLLCFKLPIFIYLVATGEEMRKISMIPCLQNGNWLLIFACVLAGISMPLAMKHLTDKFKLKIWKNGNRK